MAQQSVLLRRSSRLGKNIRVGNLGFQDFGSHNGLPAYDARFEHSEPHSVMWMRGRPRYWYHYLESLAQMPEHLSAPPRTPRGLQRVSWIKAFRSPMDPTTHEVFRETDTRTASVWEWAEQAQKYLDLVTVHDNSPILAKPHPSGLRNLDREKRPPPRGFSGRPPALHAAQTSADFDPSRQETEADATDRMAQEDFPDMGDASTHTRIYPTASSTVRRWAPRAHLPSSHPAKNKFLLWLRKCIDDRLYTPPTSPPVEWTRDEHAAAERQMSRCIADYLACFYYVHGSAATWHPAQKVLSPAEVWQLERAAKRVHEGYLDKRPAAIRAMVKEDAEVRARARRGEPVPTSADGRPLLRAFVHDESELWDFSDVWACMNDSGLYGPREWFLIHYWMDRYWPMAKHFAPAVLKYAGRRDVRDALVQMPLMPVWMQETMFDVYEGRLGPDRFDWVEMYTLNATDPLRFTPSRLATMYRCTVEEARQCMMLGDMVSCVRDGREFDNERWVEWLDREAEIRARPVYRMRSDLFRVVGSSEAFKELVAARAKTFESIVAEDIPRPAGAGVWSDHPNTQREDSTADEADTWAARDDVPSWCGPHWERLRHVGATNALTVEVSPQLPWNHPFGALHKQDPNHHTRADLRRALVRTADGVLRTARGGEREAAFDDFISHEVSWYKARGAMLPTPSSRADARPVMFPLAYDSKMWFDRREGDVWKFVDNVGALEQHQVRDGECVLVFRSVLVRVVVTIFALFAVAVAVWCRVCCPPCTCCFRCCWYFLPSFINAPHLTPPQESRRFSGVPDSALHAMYGTYHTPFESGMPGTRPDAAVHRERVMAADLARWSYRV